VWTSLLLGMVFYWSKHGVGEINNDSERDGIIIWVVTPCCLVGRYLLDSTYDTLILQLWSHVPVFFAEECSDKVSLQPS
jgi:hypothetical protein